MLKIFKKLSGILVDILIVLLVIITIYCCVQKFILKKDYINICGYTILKVITGSMANTINIGDIIIVKVTQNVEENEIIVFKEENSLVTHRLIEKQDETYITKGDANNSEDLPINKDAVIGKVIKIIPNIAIIEKVLMQKEVFISLILTVTLFGVAFILKDKGENNG